MFENLIAVNGEPRWRDDVPERLQNMAWMALYELGLHQGRGHSYESVVMWAKRSLTLLDQAVKKEADWFAESILKGEIANTENTRRMTDHKRNLSTREMTSSLDNYFCYFGMEKHSAAEMKLSISDGESLPAKVLAGLALLLFDAAATKWRLGKPDVFIESLYDAEMANSAYIHYASKRMGEFTAKPNHSILARKGAQARSARYQPLKDLTYELVNARKFKSRRNAAKTITPEILNYARNLGIGLSADQAEITITRWLEEKGLPANV